MKPRGTRERVVVTGVGAVTPIGNTAPEFWNSLQKGVSGCSAIRYFDTTEYKTKIACQVKDFNPAPIISEREQGRLDKFSQYCVVASHEAYQHAGLHNAEVDPTRGGVVLGIGVGGYQTIEDSLLEIRERGPRITTPFYIPKLISNIGPAHVAKLHNVQGPVYTVTTACASGSDAILQSTRLIEHGTVDYAIAGGGEACVTCSCVAGFNALRALSTRYNDTPQKASRPFDAHRDGFVIGEGSGILILEALSHAVARKATIYAEIVGGAATNDAFHITAPHPQGRGIIRAMKDAMQDAGISPQDIGYINAHGTSTQMNDKIETQSIKEVFGEHAYSVKISSTKSMHGHTIGATGGMEAIACVQALQHSFIPPTINYETPDPECDLDYTPNTGKPLSFRYAMSNSLGFGGHNTVLILKKWEE